YLYCAGTRPGGGAFDYASFPLAKSVLYDVRDGHYCGPVITVYIQDAGLSQISVTNSAINNLPPDVDLVITHRDLTERAMRQVPQA
ncbi:hypothetical protein MJL79_28855, partial [Salmonella enterica subsp. enterica serovar Montevideo]|nr:hypothetical protein [Salmonella enterica subsp. enterica serovar Montevideo]